MPPRRKKTRRRRKTFSILNGLEALTYASILSEGVTGGNLAQFLGGATDIGWKSASGNVGIGVAGEMATGMISTGTGQISLGDIFSEPSLALNTMGGNFQANILPMAFSAFVTSVGFSVGRKLLRKPLSSVTRNIIHPVLGKGVRM
jgi:hypothetical protein